MTNTRSKKANQAVYAAEKESFGHMWRGCVQLRQTAESVRYR